MKYYISVYVYITHDETEIKDEKNALYLLYRNI